MQHPLELEIREKLSAYLANEISLHDFEDWFFPKTWDIDKLGDPTLSDLVYQIKSNWSEYADGDLSEKDFRSALLSLAQTYTISAPSIRLVHGTSSKSLRYPSLTMRFAQSVDIRSSAVCG